MHHTFLKMSNIAASLILVINCTWFAGAPQTKVRHDKPENKPVTIQVGWCSSSCYPPHMRAIMQVVDVFLPNLENIFVTKPPNWCDHCNLREPPWSELASEDQGETSPQNLLPPNTTLVKPSATLAVIPVLELWDGGLVVPTVLR